MNISEYMNKTPVYSVKNWISGMESLLTASAKTGNFPFYQDDPMPENTNLITGSRRYDLNAQRLELHAAAAGVDRTLWVFAADAEILDLQPKDGAKPLLVFSNITEDPQDPGRLEAHQAYLLDQFTPEALSRLYEYASPESVEPGDINSRRRYIFAKMAVLNIANYDTGIRDKSARLAALKHIQENSDSQNPAFEDAKNACRHYAAHSRTDVFNRLRSYYTRQVSGLPLNSPKDPGPSFSLAALLKDIPKTITSMFHARIFVKRLENESFFLDYSRSNPPRAAFIRQDEPAVSPPARYPERSRR
jgi:hypothetical protein